MTLLLLLGACHKPAAEPPPALVAPAAPPRVVIAPTGALEDGVWTDSLYAFSLTVPAGWTASPGGADGARLHLRDPVRGVDVAVRAVPGGSRTPVPRPECAWDFVDTSRYRVLHLPGAITVATCTPTDPDGPRVLGWYFGEPDVAWHVEATIPPGSLADGRRGVEGLLGTVRLR